MTSKPQAQFAMSDCGDDKGDFMGTLIDAPKTLRGLRPYAKKVVHALEARIHPCDWVASLQADITCRMEIGCQPKNSERVPRNTPVHIVSSEAKLACHAPIS